MKEFELTASRLKLAMELKGIKPIELSRLAEYNKSSISQYLSGIHAPSKEGAEALAKVLDVNPAWLFGFNAPMKTGDVTMLNTGELELSKFITVGDTIISTSHIVMIKKMPNGQVCIQLDTGESVTGKMQGVNESDKSITVEA